MGMRTYATACCRYAQSRWSARRPPSTRRCAGASWSGCWPAVRVPVASGTKRTEWGVLLPISGPSLQMACSYFFGCREDGHQAKVMLMMRRQLCLVLHCHGCTATSCLVKVVAWARGPMEWVRSAVSTRRLQQRRSFCRAHRAAGARTANWVNNLLELDFKFNQYLCRPAAAAGRPRGTARRAHVVCGKDIVVRLHGITAGAEIRPKPLQHDVTVNTLSSQCRPAAAAGGPGRAGRYAHGVFGGGAAVRRARGHVEA